MILKMKTIIMIVSGIAVAELSMDGHYNIDSYLNHTSGIGIENLDDFTICLRFNVNFLKQTSSSLVSYSTSTSDNSINFYIDYISGGSLLLYICKYYDRNQGCGYYRSDDRRILHEEWHHTCLTLKTEEMDSNRYRVSTKLYFDGNLAEKGR